ncbi:MAG: hypothetical protein VB017_00085 [Endomicrobiaceae bacterium]|nr:hypothetical protein [Endomicrobiaceae bacterium]
MKTKKSKIKAKIPKNTAKKTGFKPKAWAVKLIKEHKVLMDGLKDR